MPSITYLFVNMMHCSHGAFISPTGCFEVTILGMQNNAGILYNSEVWHSISGEEIRMLEMVDEHLLRLLVKGHSKTPLEFLYLEVGAIPIRFIISSRRILYLQTILQRPDKELIKRVYNAQKTNTVKGDFCELVRNDIELLGGTFTEEYIAQTGRDTLKTEIKSKLGEAAFEYLYEKQQKHSKVSNIHYNKLETQTYIKCPLFNNEEVNLLHALRSRMINVKNNFSSKFQNNLLCPLCENERDDQPHVLECTELQSIFNTKELSNGKVKHDDIFGAVDKQKEATQLFLQLLNIRNELVDENLVKKANPSSSTEMLVDCDYLHHSIVHYSSGK